MSFDVNTVIDDMLTAIKGSVNKDWKEVKTASEQFLTRDKKRLEMIATLRITGELTLEDFESRLEDQKKIIEAELNALAVIGKALAQNAANAAIEVLEKAVMGAIKAAL
jgi:chaperonin GroEL (HSP60 family)